MKKNLSRTLMLTAAVMTLGAAATYGENAVIANVPFSFRITGAEMQAGKYKVTPAGSMSGDRTMRLRNVRTGESRVVLATTTATESRKGAAPRLIFRCGGQSGCSLASIWTGGGGGWELSLPRLKASEKEHLAVIFLNRTDAE